MTTRGKSGNAQGLQGQKKSAGFRRSFQIGRLRVLPGFHFRGGQAGDGLLGVRGLGAADAVEEELAVRRLHEGLLIAGGVAEGAEGLLADQLGGLGVLLDLADNLFHVCFLSRGSAH